MGAQSGERDEQAATHSDANERELAVAVLHRLGHHLVGLRAERGGGGGVGR